MLSFMKIATLDTGNTDFIHRIDIVRTSRKFVTLALHGMCHLFIEGNANLGF